VLNRIGKIAFGLFPRATIKRHSLIGSNPKHAAPKSETLAPDKKVAVQHSRVSFLECRGQETIVTAAVL
jgi:hypothetical protein